MDKKIAYGLLIVIFLVAFGLNLFSVFINPLQEDSYLTVRYSEEIKEDFLFSSEDKLSYGGKEIEEPLIFYHLLSLGLRIDESLVKIIPALLMSLLVPLVFLISTNFTSSRLSLIPAILAGFVPVIFKINIISQEALAFPILFLMIYSFTKIDNKKYLYTFLILSVLLPLTSSLSIFYIFSILIYLLIINIERKKLTEIESESLLFSLFINIIIVLVLFNKALITYGAAFIWQNTPLSILENFFREFSIITAIGNVGVLTLFLGVVGLGYSFKDKQQIFLASFLISTLTFLWLRLIPFEIGMVIMSLTLAGLSSLSIKALIKYIKDTKFSKYKEKIILGIFVIVIISSVLPSVIESVRVDNSINQKSIDGLMFIKEESIILAPYEYGHLITFLGHKNVADSSFLLAPNPQKRLEDIELVYTTKSETLVLEIVQRYKINYILFDNKAREQFLVEKLEYVKNQECFLKIFDDGGTEIYEVKC